jgi:hypothetical protein
VLAENFLQIDGFSVFRYLVQVKSTEDFIDSDTDTAKILLVFFTPSAGITSVLTISTEFMGAAAAELTLQLNHYEMLEGDQLTSYVVVQVCATLTRYRICNTGSGYSDALGSACAFDCLCGRVWCLFSSSLSSSTAFSSS